MSDQIQQRLRDAFDEQAAQLDPTTISRLKAIDYHPRQRRVRALPAVGALGLTGAGAAVAAIVALGSSAAPAFAGWKATPTAPTRSQLGLAVQACGQGLGSPVLSESRGPYTAAIYASSTETAVCLTGSSGSLWSNASTGSEPSGPTAGQIAISGGGTRDSAGNDFTIVDGRIGSGVTAVTIQRSDGSTVQATVSGGWYLAWWPGTSTASSAQVTTGSGTDTQSIPQAPLMTNAPSCPTGGHCSIGYAYSGSGSGSGGAGAGGTSTGGTSVSGSSAAGGVGTDGLHRLRISRRHR